MCGELFARVATALDDVSFEVIFVDDDSPDGTAAAVGELAAIDRRVRCLRRIGRRGLSSACIEGMLATPARYLAVIDADLQHDETLLPRMLEVLRQGETGSRPRQPLPRPPRRRRLGSSTTDDEPVRHLAQQPA